MKTKFFLLLERLESIGKRFGPAYRQAGLNLSRLARLLSQTGISVDLRHGKREAYLFSFIVDYLFYLNYDIPKS
jgi:hypothetical protein